MTKMKSDEQEKVLKPGLAWACEVNEAPIDDADDAKHPFPGDMVRNIKGKIVIR